MKNILIVLLLLLGIFSVQTGFASACALSEGKAGASAGASGQDVTEEDADEGADEALAEESA